MIQPDSAKVEIILRMRSFKLLCIIKYSRIIFVFFIFVCVKKSFHVDNVVDFGFLFNI